MKIETRKALWVSSSFTEKFGNEEVLPAPTVPPFVVLARGMNDAEITKEYGSHECTLADVAAFLENPPEGKEGDLLNNGYWNIFYVAGYVVGVRWRQGFRRWRVRAWKLDDAYWDAGGRVFARNSTSGTQSPSLSPSDSLTLRIEALEAFRDRVIELIPTLKV